MRQDNDLKRTSKSTTNCVGFLGFFLKNTTRQKTVIPNTLVQFLLATTAQTVVRVKVQFLFHIRAALVIIYISL